MESRWGRSAPPLRARLPVGAVLLVLFSLLGPAKPAAAYTAYYDTYAVYRLGTGQQCFGDPVDLATGAFLIRSPLASIPGRVPMALDWLFTSLDKSAGPLGTGTSLSTDWYLVASTIVPNRYDLCGPGDLHFVLENQSGNGDYVNTTDPEMLGAKYDFTVPTNGLAGTLRWKDGTLFRFDSSGGLVRVDDTHGNFITITRNAANGFPTEIRQPGGRSIQLAYGANGLLSSVSLPLDRVWQFSYDSSSPPRLTRVTDPTGAHTDYTWSTYLRSDNTSLPLVRTVTDRLGHTRVVNGYDPQGRVISQTYADGGVLAVNYGGSCGAGASCTTTVTDPLGNVSSWNTGWTQTGYGYAVTLATDALHRTTTPAYGNPPSNLPTSITDFLGRVTTLQWDFTRGNLLALTVPSAHTDGTQASESWSFAYDATFNKVTSVTDQFGRETSFTIDPNTGDVTKIRDPKGYFTTLQYSRTGDLLVGTNALGQTTRLGYTSDGDLQTVTDAANNQTSYSYDSASRLIGVRDGNGKPAQIGYTPLDDVSQVTRWLNLANPTWTPVITQFQYDAEQNLRLLIDPRGYQRQWVYDSKNRVVQEIDPLGQSSYAAWDCNDNLMQWLDRKGQTGAYTFDPVGRVLTAIIKQKDDASAGINYTYTYSGSTHLLSSVGDSLAGTFNYSYDWADRLVEEDWIPTGPSPPTYRDIWQLDEIGRRTSLTPNGQTQVTYAFDPEDNVIGVTQGGATTTLVYDPLGRLVQRVLPATNGFSTITTWSFDVAGRLTGLVSSRDGQAIDSHTYQVDALGNITQDAINNLGVTWSYTLDDLYRLTLATLGSANYSWVYDLAGNRLSQNAGGAITSYAYDPANRLTGVNGVPVSYDANGNAVAYGNDVYSWDALDRMTGLSRPGLSASYLYDHLGRRRSVTTNGTSTSFVYDGDDIVSEITGGSTISTLHGPFVDDVIQRNALYYTPNHLGSTTTLTDSTTGAVAEQYFYFPFGQTWQSAGTSNPFQFTGRENDGTGLDYYRARYYLEFRLCS